MSNTLNSIRCASVYQLRTEIIGSQGSDETTDIPKNVLKNKNS